MKKTLTTLTAICIAIFTIQAATIQVSPGTNTIFNAINAASSGDTLIIADGTYNEPNTTVINKALTIKAAEGANPFVNHKRYDINVGSGDHVTIQGLIFDNTDQPGTEMVRVNSGTNNNLKFIDCTFQNGTSYGIRLYLTAVQVDTFLVSGCVFKNLQHMAIYSINGGSSPGRFKNAIIKNSTFINIVHPSDLTHAIYLRDNDGAEGNDPKVLIDHCTFYNTAPGSYVIYLNRIAGATIRNCIVSNDADKKSNFAYYVYGNTILSNSIWFNCNSGVRSGGAIATNLLNTDPMFINPALNDFNLDVNSPAVGAATDGLNIGDTRWTVAAAELSISITAPATDVETSDTYRISFVPLDPSGDATISLYYSTDNENWTLIVDNLTSSVMFYDWNVRTFDAGNYYVKAVIDDGSETVSDVSAGRVVVVPDVIPPRAPADLTGNFAEGKVTLSWINPTSSVPVLTSVDNFESGIGAFVETKSGTADGSFLSTTGQTGNGMQVNYDIQTAWSQYGVKTNFATPVDYASTIEFWYKGDGSSNRIRVIVEQGNGDWWNREVLLNSTEWQKAELALSTFTAFSWRPNQEPLFNNMNVTALNFIVASGTVTTGHFVIDEINFSGAIPPSLDFEGTKIVRRTDRYPVNHTDGVVIYDGAAETFVDEDIASNTNYYYAAFSYDDLYNYSSYNTNAAFMYDGTISSKPEIGHAGLSFKVFPNVIETSANIRITLNQSQNVKIDVFNLAGIKVAEIVNREMSEGMHSIPFNTNLLNNGLYFVKMCAGTEIIVEKVLISK